MFSIAALIKGKDKSVEHKGHRMSASRLRFWFENNVQIYTLTYTTVIGFGKIQVGYIFCQICLCFVGFIGT